MSLLLRRLQAELERIKPTTICIIEPDKTIADLLVSHLTDYQTAVFSNGRDAFAYCQQTPPRLILLDSKLPDMDALLFFRQILPVKFMNNMTIFIIGQRYDSRELRMKALEMGVDDFIHKPFDIVELQLRIKNALPDAAKTVDLVTGLPDWPATHHQLQQHLNQDGWQIILLRVSNMNDYLDVYGTPAGQQVRRMLAAMLHDIVDDQGTAADFIGSIGVGDFVIMTQNGQAAQMVADFTTRFNQECRQWYAAPDLAAQRLHLSDGRRASLMVVSTAVVDSQAQSFSSSLDIITTLEGLRQQSTPPPEQAESPVPPWHLIYAAS